MPARLSAPASCTRADRSQVGVVGQVGHQPGIAAAVRGQIDHHQVARRIDLAGQAGQHRVQIGARCERDPVEAGLVVREQDAALPGAERAAEHGPGIARLAAEQVLAAARANRDHEGSRVRRAGLGQGVCDKGGLRRPQPLLVDGRREVVVPGRAERSGRTAPSAVHRACRCTVPRRGRLPRQASRGRRCPRFAGGGERRGKPARAGDYRGEADQQPERIRIEAGKLARPLNREPQDLGDDCDEEQRSGKRERARAEAGNRGPDQRRNNWYRRKEQLRRNQRRILGAGKRTRSTT